MMSFQFVCQPIAVSAYGYPSRQLWLPISSGYSQSSLCPYARDFLPKGFHQRKSSLSPHAEEFIPKNFSLESRGTSSSAYTGRSSPSAPAALSSDENFKEAFTGLRIFIANVTLDPDSFDKDAVSASKIIREFLINGGSVHEVHATIDDYAAKVVKFRAQVEKVRQIVSLCYRDARVRSGALHKRSKNTQGRRRSPYRYSEQRRSFSSVFQPSFSEPGRHCSIRQTYPDLMTRVN